MDRVISVVRSATALTAVVLKAPPAFCSPCERSPKDGPPGPRYVLARVPLASVARDLCPGREALLQSWQRLADASLADEHCPTNVLHVLRETVPEPTQLEAELVLEQPPTPHRATAAHPRAYRGTIQQPPKMRQPRRQDLRPVLCDSRALDILLKAIDSSLPADPALVYRHPDAPRDERPHWPELFAAEWWPLLRGMPWPDVRRWSALYYQLDPDASVRAAVTRLLSESSDVLAWCELLPSLALDQRYPFLEALIESKLFASPLSDQLRAGIAEVASCCHEQFVHRIWELLNEVRRGVDVAYLADGCRLAAELGHRSCLHPGNGAVEYSGELIRELFDQLTPNIEPYRRLRYWEDVSLWEPWASWLRRESWRSLSGKQLAALLELLRLLDCADVERPREKRLWPAILATLDDIFESVRGLPDELAKPWQDALGQAFELWDSPEDARDAWPALLALVTRLLQQPNARTAHFGRTVCRLINVRDEVLRRRILSAPERSFAAIFDASTRSNAAGLTQWGLRHLLMHFPELTVELFCTHPVKLLRVARILGAASGELQTEALRSLRDEPLLKPMIADADLGKLLALLDVTSAAQRCNPVPAALRQAMHGERSLTANQLARHERVLRERLELTQLQLIEERTWEFFNRGVGADLNQEGFRHAVQLLRDVDGNERGFKRALRALRDGDSRFIERHPETQRWYSRHPRVPAELWTNGIVQHVEVDGRRYTLAVEQELLEVLKLGTYVGSCLGVGGICSESAPATLLDANKRVVYARDESGTVVARQLLAISKDDRLIPFSVYAPSSNSLESLTSAFRAYDVAFAKALELPLGPNDGGYKIEQILSDLWWDDGAWEDEVLHTSSRASDTQVA